MNIPIIELYEYEIHGHPNDNTMVKYGNLDDSPVDEKTLTLSDCKRVSIENSETSPIPDLKLSSCDPIQSIAGGGSLKKYRFYDIENLYPNYKNFIAKNTNISEELNERSKIEFLNNIETVLNIQQNYIIESLKKNYNEDLKNLYDFINTNKYDESNECMDKITIKNEDTGLIQKINITSDHKIILMGDFHGSYHTFFRNLCRFHRYNILNLDTFVINDPYKIIFLGDILDRGRYAFDILYIIFKLMVINNTNQLDPKIILNKGNHESFLIFSRDGGLDELYQKLSLETKDENFIKKFLYLFNKTLCVLPCATIITCNDKKFWCCHGGFPRMYLDNNIPDDDIIYLNKLHSYDVRWSDFNGGDDSKDYDINISRGGGDCIYYTYKGTLKFLDRNNINFIFRGHQDSISNSSIFFNAPNLYLRLNNQSYDTKKFLYYNTNRDNILKNRTVGPIARLITNKNTMPKTIPAIFPLLTISTNTDYERRLTSDSFALLRFDIEETEITDFNKKSLSLINSIRFLFTHNKKINKEDILMNNLETTKLLFEKLNDVSNLNLMHYIKNKSLYDANDIYYKLKYFDFSIPTQIYQIYAELLDVYDYYIKKTENVLNKLAMIQQNINNQTALHKVVDKLRSKKNEVTTAKQEIDVILNSTILLDNNKIEISYKVNNTIIKNILDDLNKIIIKYDLNNN